MASLATMVVIYFVSGLWIQREIRRELIAWDSGVLLFLALALLYMHRTGIAQMKERADAHDAGAHPILFATVLAAVASVGALVAELSQAKGEPASGLHVLLAGSTVVLSWLFVQFIFAIHYAHLYYLDGSDGGIRGGLSFGAYGDPDYWDFLHFSLVLGATSQTADITFTSREMRRLGTLHTLVAFGFNTAILATMINLAAGLF
ncbi:MAG: DUF1345 domain-containing protein [Rhizomicrobium sp.]|jgi:uncharacterized membrane protein